MSGVERGPFLRSKQPGQRPGKDTGARMALARICVFVTAMFTICAAAPVCTTSFVCIAAQAKEADGKSAEVRPRVEQSVRGTDVIPLHVREPEPGTYRPEVD